MTRNTDPDADRIPFGEETHEVLGEGQLLYLAPSDNLCHDCQVERGELHAKGCDVEQCPVCKHQLIGCEHAKSLLGEEPEVPRKVKIRESPWALLTGDNVECVECPLWFATDHPQLPLMCQVQVHKGNPVCPHCALDQ